MDRRTFLARAGLAVGGTGALGGCLEGSSSDPTDGTMDDQQGDDGTPMDDGTGSDGGATATYGDGAPFGEHAATAGIGTQPYLGPKPGTAEGTIVAFEDPSCPRCRRFQRETVSKITSELVDPGTATYVFRGYPVVYAWGKPAARALEATYQRDEATHWELQEWYFRNQGEFSPGNVRERTRSFLEGKRAVDAAAVMDALDADGVDEAIDTDLDAGENAGAGGVTPTVFLFKDGEYRTMARGSVSYSVVAGALGV